MGWRDKVREAVVTHTTDPEGTPSLARRATQVAAVLGDTAGTHHLTAAAVAVSGLGSLAVAAEGALSNYVYPPGEYATFDTDRKGGAR
ncbi:hypothetical protein [Streptomyces sp. NBC_01497]|uniref:hypothetical protein n=1 Tax=Streptomyces sp. NBC_01497 TaxID=2903885 RepID=UPI002E37177A|nr:hypothetical protein [Streptomyces sp. NBC_01497]